MFVVLIITEVNRQLIFYQNNIGIMTTNFKKVIAIFAGSLMFMASCSDIDDSFYGNEEGMIALKCSRSADWTLRNAAVDTDGKGSFEAGDRIEMNISTAGTTSNTTLQYSGSQWMPALKRSEYGTGELLLSRLSYFATGCRGRKHKNHKHTCRPEHNRQPQCNRHSLRQNHRKGGFCSCGHAVRTCHAPHKNQSERFHI